MSERYKMRFLILILFMLGSNTSWGWSAKPWQIDFGGFYLSPEFSGANIPGIPGSGIDTSSDFRLGFAISAHLTDHLAIRTNITPPFKLVLIASGAASALGTIGNYKSWGTTLIAQWSFGSKDQFIRPFVGVGVLYATFHEEEASASLEQIAGGPVGLKFDNACSALWKLGVDIRVTDQWRSEWAIMSSSPETRVWLSSQSASLSQKIGIEAMVYSVTFSYRF